MISNTLKTISFDSYGAVLAKTDSFNGDWNFYTITVSGNISTPTLTIYLNNSSETFALSALSATPDLTVPIQIGANRTGEELWRGNIASCIVYNRTLSVTEILQNYNALKSRFNL
jgi:hypothetical protein